jgi:ketosteroid isomerase-like protein
MNAQQNKQLVMEGYRRFQNKDIEGVLERFAEDVEWVGPELDSAPFSGNYHGKDEVRRFFVDLDAAQEATRFEPTAFIAEDDKVAVTGTATWHVKSTGLDYSSPWAHVFTVHDGKVTRFEQYVDTAATEHAYRPTAGAEASQPDLRH